MGGVSQEAQYVTVMMTVETAMMKQSVEVVSLKSVYVLLLIFYD